MTEAQTPATMEHRMMCDAELSANELAMIDQAWENHKAAIPVATVINDNQPGRTAIIEISKEPPTLTVGTRLYEEAKSVPLEAKWRTELSEIIGHLGSAITQSCDKDDRIIMDHVKAAYEIAKVVRRQA